VTGGFFVENGAGMGRGVNLLGSFQAQSARTRASLPAARSAQGAQDGVGVTAGALDSRTALAVQREGLKFKTQLAPFAVYTQRQVELGTLHSLHLPPPPFLDPLQTNLKCKQRIHEAPGKARRAPARAAVGAGAGVRL
jgi:hypothetical protein